MVLTTTVRTAKEMVKYSSEHNNWQLQGVITYAEFVFIRQQIDKLGKASMEELDTNGFWDHCVVNESLRRDRQSVHTRYWNRYYGRQK